MPTHAQIHQMMVEIGPLLELDEIIPSTQEPSWVLWRDGFLLAVEFDEASETLHFVSDVGAVADETKLRTYELMLRFNSLSHQTGGARLGLEDLEDSVQFLIDLRATEMDLTQFASFVDDCFVKTALWADIAARLADPAVAAPTDDDLAHTFGFIRV